MPTLLVAVGGALGAVLRYRVGLAVSQRGFPWATLLVNLSGCLVLAAVLAGPGASRWSTQTTTAVAVGVLGAYTTFSTFGYETFQLLRTDRLGAAALYVSVSLVGGLGATALGFWLGRLLVR